MSASAPASTANGHGPDGIDTVKLLVQRVARQFYGVRGAILVDQLVKKEVYRDEDIAKRLGMQPKDIAKIAHRLVEDQIVQVHRRSEMRDNGMAKAQLRTYYYFDYSKATDVIKWRMWKIQQTIDVKLRNELETQGYVCPLCKATYTHLDAAALFDPFRNVFACSVCQTEVINNENEAEVKGNKDRMQRLNRQTKSVVDLLKGLEKVEVPRFNVESYLAIHGPALGITAQAAAEAAGTAPAQAAVVKVHLAGDDDEALEKARREEEVRRKREQNALPSWIAQSTIAAAQDGEARAGTGSPAPTSGAAEPFSASALPGLGATMRLGDQDAQPLPSAGADDAPAGGEGGGVSDLDAYYASLAQSVGPSFTPTPAPGEGGYYDPDEREGTFSATASLAGTPAPPGLTNGARGFTEELGDAVLASFGAGGAGKRAREDSLAAVGEAVENGEPKRQRTGRTFSPSVPPSFSRTATLEPVDSPALPPPPPVAPPAAAEEEEEDDDDFEPADGDAADPNQEVSVNGRMVPFSEVTEEMTGEMTADEYSRYWEIYALQ
ncbi:hypothetical protein JCM8097_000613 [Rhodosporidiobolus ruineniae]